MSISPSRSPSTSGPNRTPEPAGPAASSSNSATSPPKADADAPPTLTDRFVVARKPSLDLFSPEALNRAIAPRPGSGDGLNVHTDVVATVDRTSPDGGTAELGAGVRLEGKGLEASVQGTAKVDHLDDKPVLSQYGAGLDVHYAREGVLQPGDKLDVSGKASISGGTAGADSRSDLSKLDASLGLQYTKQGLVRANDKLEVSGTASVSRGAGPDAELQYAGALSAKYSGKDVLTRGDSLDVTGDAYVRGGDLEGKPPEFGVRASAEYHL